MSTGSILRSRRGAWSNRARGDTRSPGHERRKRRLTLAAAGGAFDPGRAFDAAVAAAGASDMPHLVMPEPESARGPIVTSAISALLHVLVLAAIAALGYFAQDVVEEIIPVTIINSQPIELPGSNNPAPVPKMLSSAPAMSAAALATAPAAISAVPAAALQAPSLDSAPPPTKIDMAAVSVQTIAPQIAAIAPRPRASAITDVKRLNVNPSELLAPPVNIQAAPTVVASSTNVRIPTNVALDPIARDIPRYEGAVATRVESAATGAEVAGTTVTTEVSGELLTGGVGFLGGDPNGAVGTVPCMQSAYVHRYKDVIEERTRARWILPMSATPDDEVTLSFKLDHAGRVTRIEIVSSSNEAFGQSALEALSEASPFPPLDDNVRCLSEMKRLTLSFTNS